jgi:hypothetical protein
MRGNKLTIKSIPQKNSWCDKEIAMVHAMFQLLVDCIEKEKLFEDRVYYLDGGNGSKEHKKIAAELNDLKLLYKWWKGPGRRMNESEIRSDEVNDKCKRLIDLKEHLWV